MLTSKQLSFLKKLASKEKAVFQIGKDGISDNLVNDILAFLKKNELMKLSILVNSEIKATDMEDALATYGVELVQTIGRVIVIYKKSETAKKPIVLPK